MITYLWLTTLLVLTGWLADEKTTILKADVSPSVLPPGKTFKLTYNWDCIPMGKDYLVWVQVIDRNGNIVFYDDHRPPFPTRTSNWSGRQNYTRPMCTPEDIKEGDYRIIAGLFDQESGRQELHAGKGVIPGDSLSYHIGTFTIDSGAPDSPLDSDKPETLNLAGYSITFHDEFDEPLDVSARGPGTRWIAHTPYSGDFGAISEINPGNDAIINEAALRHFGFENAHEALGYKISIGDKSNIQIIGFVKDFVIQSTDFEPDPLVIRVIPERFDYALLKINPAYETKDILSLVETSWKKLNTEQLFKYKFYSDHIDDYQHASMKIVQVLGFITFLTIFISVLGLLGMVVFNNENRVNEIGIRKVVGANNNEILWVISKSFFYMMFLAVLIATPLAWLLGKMILQNAYHRVTLKPGFFLTGILFLLIIGVITVFSQTWKASNLNTADVLKYE